MLAQLTISPFHRLFKSRNSPTTGILLENGVHYIRHVYRSMWPTREAKPRFGTTLEPSAHDCETHLLLTVLPLLGFYRQREGNRRVLMTNKRQVHLNK